MLTYKLDALREEDVQSIVDAGLHEGHRLDYKGREVPEDLEATIAAMANTEGGLIVLGVEEKQGIPQQVIGMRAGRDNMKLRLLQRIHANVSPRPQIRIGIALMRDDHTRVVGIIEVDRGDLPPYVHHQTHIRVRRGSKNEHATLQDIEQMIARRGKVRERAHEVMSAFHDQHVEPHGGLSNEDARRYLRLQTDVAPIAPLQVLIDNRIEGETLELIARSFRWTDSCPRIVDRDVDSVDIAVTQEGLGVRRWGVRANGHFWFATPVVHGGLRQEGLPQVFLTDVAVDLMRALAWSARSSRRFGESGDLMVGGTLWLQGCSLENDSQTRVQRLDGKPVPLAGVVLGAPRRVNPRVCNQLVPLAELETADGAAAVAAEILRTALRSQFRAEIDLPALTADLRAREADSFE